MTRRHTLPAAVLSALFALSAAFAAPAQEAKKADAPPAAADLRAKADAAFQAQNWTACAELYEKVVAATPDDGTAWHHLGYSLHMIGKLDAALPAHIKAAGFQETAGIASYNAACAYSLKNEPDKAFEWLDKAIASGFAALNYLDSDTDLENIKKDPRFAKIKKELAANDRQQAFVATTPRASTRLAFFGQAGSAGQIAIDYGQPAWREDFGAAVESKRYVGQRWRLGQDYWTTWDSSCDVTLAGTPIKAGQYYLTMKQNADGSYVLEFLDAAAARAAKLDASMAARYSGPLTVVPLAAEKTDTLAKQLQFQIAHEADGRGTLSIHFGNHKASAPLVVDMPKSNA